MAAFVRSSVCCTTFCLVSRHSLLVYPGFFTSMSGTFLHEQFAMLSPFFRFYSFGFRNTFSLYKVKSSYKKTCDDNNEPECCRESGFWFSLCCMPVVRIVRHV